MKPADDRFSRMFEILLKEKAELEDNNEVYRLDGPFYFHRFKVILSWMKYIDTPLCF